MHETVALAALSPIWWGLVLLTPRLNSLSPPASIWIYTCNNREKIEHISNDLGLVVPMIFTIMVGTLLFKVFSLF